MDVQALLATSLGLDQRETLDSDCVAVQCFGDSFPHVSAMVGCTRAGGVDRDSSTLTIFADDGSLSLCLRDRSLGRVLYASGDCFEDALAELEAHLRSGKPRWRKETSRKR